MFGRELLAHPWSQSFAAVLFLGVPSALLAGPYDGSALGRALLVLALASHRRMSGEEG